MPCTTDMTLCKKKMSLVQLFVCGRFEKKKKTRCKYDFDKGCMKKNDLQSTTRQHR